MATTLKDEGLITQGATTNQRQVTFTDLSMMEGVTAELVVGALEYYAGNGSEILARPVNRLLFKFRRGIDPELEGRVLAACELAARRRREMGMGSEAAEFDQVASSFKAALS